jgi:hypothetical protein
MAPPLINLAPVTLAPLVAGPSFDGKTSSLWLQISIGPGYYNQGGIPTGIQAFASKAGIDVNQFLAAYIQSEATWNPGGGSYPAVGTMTYHYVPSTDLLQIFNDAGVELQPSEGIIPAVLNDTIVAQVVYNRL